ncbi:hypothetical protein IF129_18590 [Streptomyces chumphonensis]|uniref:Secreted protein n=1 Tax=Streptomyces chumphonensis TaxID=1214925 RepID=A0A927IC22_9ACTN|nr:hypothetical protein [Streptomyces chumphonensis]MBD3933553.1 hypothetical protein [Streptomyces chumphonensis]
MSSLRRSRTILRSAIVVAFVAGSLALTSCGGGDGAPKDDQSEKSISGQEDQDKNVSEGVDTENTLAVLEGSNGVMLTIHSAVRDADGFVTVHGTAKNEGSVSFSAAEWRSQENAIKSKSSISGASLVDRGGKKRYMVLRDTDGQCLCSTGIRIASGESSPIFAQFPAPPASVTTVELSVPSMSPATVDLAEG